MPSNVVHAEEGRYERKDRQAETKRSGRSSSRRRMNEKHKDYYSLRQSLERVYKKYIEKPDDVDSKQTFISKLDSIKHENIDVNDIVFDLGRESKHSILHQIAGRDKDPKVLGILMRRFRANPNLLDEKTRTTPMHEAAAANHAMTVKLLLAHKAKDNNVQNKLQQTPLHWAAKFNAVDAIRAILENRLGHDRKNLMEAKDASKRTALFIAAEYGRAEAAACLLAFGADPTVQSDEKSDPEMCLSFMIENMESVASRALDSSYYYTKDIARREETYFLNKLEPEHLRWTGKTNHNHNARLPLEAIIFSRRLKLIQHPVIQRLIEFKWKMFGKRYTLIKLMIDFIYVLLWSALGLFVRWNERPFYSFPQDIWRVLLQVFGLLFTFGFVCMEIRHLYKSHNYFGKWKKSQIDHLTTDGKNLTMSNTSLQQAEENFVKKKIETLQHEWSPYLKDNWNIFDWVVIFLVIVVEITHFIDVSIVNRVPPCCPLADTNPCNDTSVASCLDGKVNNNSLSVWNNRIMVITIILLWLRLLKFVRAFRFFGSFIALLAFMGKDIFRFVCLFVTFYIPFCIGFWMTFGADSRIHNLHTVDRLMFTLYRMTLVDEYPYNEMLEFDFLMAYILIGLYLAICAIVFINIFIALLSDTYKRVYDDAVANGYMEQAKIIQDIESETLCRNTKKYREQFKKLCTSYKKPLKYDSSFNRQQETLALQENYSNGKISTRADYNGVGTTVGKPADLQKDIAEIQRLLDGLSRRLL